MESPALEPVHLEILPVHETWIRIPDVVTQPRGRLEITPRMMVRSLNQFHIVYIIFRTIRRELVEGILGIACEHVPVECRVLGPGPETEREICTILHRSVLERFASGNRACAGKIVRIE